MEDPSNKFLVRTFIIAGIISYFSLNLIQKHNVTVVESWHYSVKNKNQFSQLLENRSIPFLL